MSFHKKNFELNKQLEHNANNFKPFGQIGSNRFDKSVKDESDLKCKVEQLISRLLKNKINKNLSNAAKMSGNID